jgi:hypothetical protein
MPTEVETIVPTETMSRIARKRMNILDMPNTGMMSKSKISHLASD